MSRGGDRTGTLYRGRWDCEPVNRKTDRVTGLKTLPSRNFVGG